MGNSDGLDGWRAAMGHLTREGERAQAEAERCGREGRLWAMSRYRFHAVRMFTAASELRVEMERRQQAGLTSKGGVV